MIHCSMPQDENYIRIRQLSDEYLALVKKFVDAMNDDKPASERAALRQRIKTVLEEIDRLEALRSTKSNDKDELTIG